MKKKKVHKNFTALYRNCFYGALRLTGDPEDAQDLVQETFASYFAHRYPEDLPARVRSAILDRTLYQTWIAIGKKRKLFPMEQEQLLQGEEEQNFEFVAQPFIPTPEEAAERKEFLYHIAQEISRLEKPYQDIFKRLLISEEDWKASCRSMHITESAYRKRLSQGRKKLKERMEKAEIENEV